MPLIQLRAHFGKSGPDDLLVEVQEKSIEYLLGETPANVRVSTYLDRDWPLVEATYEELVIDGCEYDNLVLHLTPGSRRRTGLKLPCPMKQGEQLTLELERKLKA